MTKSVKENIKVRKNINQTLAELPCPISPRVTLVEPGTENAEVSELYESCRDMFGIVPRYIQLLAHSPSSAKSWLVFDREIKVAALRSGDRERSRMQVLCILETSLDNSCHNCSHHNVELARELGYSDEQLSSIANGTWQENAAFSDKEKAILDWSYAVTHLKASRADEVFNNLKQHCTEAEIVEFTYTTALWNCSTRFADALHLTAEPSNKGIKWDAN
ncbi:MAG: hypothetical protein VX693_09660 [Pseudomonadota bacterium]|nr:hypothetical protein [Pseudomonadota bacterium]